MQITMKIFFYLFYIFITVRISFAAGPQRRRKIYLKRPFRSTTKRRKASNGSEKNENGLVALKKKKKNSVFYL